MLKKRLKKDHIVLQEIYKEIPEVIGCKKGCNDCCGIVPVSPSEKAILGIENELTGSKENIEKGCFNCQFSGLNGCNVYENRPFMCRLFAASEDKTLQCPHGAKALKPLSVKRSRALLDKYKALFKTM